jgi:hypothetical protein
LFLFFYKDKMNTKKIDSIHFSQGYNGKVKIEARIGKENIPENWYIIENDHVEEIIKNEAKRLGYTITKTNRQKYPRLTINF